MRAADRQRLAEACARAMWQEDRASQGLGMALEAVAPGRAVVAMAVTERMVNGHGLCHGGFIFTLADSAFAFACNGHNTRTVAAHCCISFLNPGRLGDRLTAEAVERAREGRSGLYDVRGHQPGRHGDRRVPRPLAHDRRQPRGGAGGLRGAASCRAAGRDRRWRSSRKIGILDTSFVGRRPAPEGGSAHDPRI